MQQMALLILTQITVGVKRRRELVNCYKILE